MPTNRRHYRVSLADAISAHDRAITQYGGGRPGIHDLGQLEAALGRPYTGYYRPIYGKAAALIQSVAKNHGFQDGNKRTAYFLFYLLLEKSGFAIEQSSTNETSDIEHLILDVTTNFLDFDELTTWLKKRIRKAD